MNAQGADSRINSKINAKMTLTLRPLEDDQTELNIHTDTALFGKLGEFGQAVAQRKANQVISEFGKNMTRELTQEGAAAEEERAPKEEAAPVGATASARARPEPGPSEKAAHEPGPLGLTITDRESVLKWAVPSFAGLGLLTMVIWILTRRDSGRQRELGAPRAYWAGRPSVEFSVRADWG